MKNTLIKNGHIYQKGSFIRMDVLIAEGKIQQIGKELIGDEETEIIEAENLHLLPGGIDPHVHLHLPTPAGFSSDDFVSGSRAALSGGTTSLIDFVTPRRGQSIVDALHQRQKEASNSLCNINFHVSPVEWTANTKDEIIHCIQNEGIHSFKIYMAYQSSIGLSDDDIFKVMEVVGQYGGLVTMHCEVDETIEKLRKQFISQGKTSPHFHPLSRPNAVEADAVKKAIQLANKTGCPLYIVHVSTREAVSHIAQAQEKGQTVFAETCPHYLLLNDNLYDQEFEKSCAYVMSPPLRKKEDSQALWQAINDGVIQTIGTDHCPFTLKQKKQGINDFTKIPNGAGGIEHRMSLLYTYGVKAGKISLQKFVELTAENPTKIFGLKNKSVIEVGMDADLCLWDLNNTSTISKETHFQDCDLNIYEGMEVIGKQKLVIVKGEVIVI